MRPSCRGDPSKSSSRRSCFQHGTAAGQHRRWTSTKSFRDGRSKPPLVRLQQADHFNNASLSIVYNRSISACRRYAGWEEALRILHGLRSVSLQCDLVSCSSAMSVCDAASQWQRATALLETTKATLGPPDVIMYGTELNACQKGRQWQRAIRLLKDLRRSLRADVVTLNTAMCGPSSGEWQNATHLLEEAASWSLQPSMVSYNVAMRSSSWRRAAEFLMAAGKNKLRSTVTTCGTMLACELPWTAELVHLSQMQREQLEPNLITLSSVLSALAIESWQTSLDLLAEAQKREMQPNEFALSAATSGCEQSAEWELASPFVFQLDSVPSNFSTCCVKLAPDCKRDLSHWLRSCAICELFVMTWCHLSLMNLRSFRIPGQLARSLSWNAAASAAAAGEIGQQAEVKSVCGVRRKCLGARGRVVADSANPVPLNRIL
ncbi:MRL1 [Symbiodinium sp. CCMP2592]|nr:MRL1 [Symbiodinium sp. CCMP2592]